VTERFPQEQFDFTHLFSIFDVHTLQGLTQDELCEFGNQEIVCLIEKLCQLDDGTKKFYCKVPFVDTKTEGIVDQVRCP
jgi:hypothetical protein